MITPDLKEIFDKLDFTDEVTPELAAAQDNTRNAFEKLVKSYNIGFDDRNALDMAYGNEAIATHYLGFTQGFRWAVYLLTGRKDTSMGEETARGEMYA